MDRFLYNLLVFASLFMFEWYFFGGVLIIGIFLFEEFYEGLIYAIIFDLIYGLRNPDLFYMRFVISSTFVLILLIGERIKKYLRYYPET